MVKNIIVKPFQKFVKIESLSGLLLFTATILALIWANSSYAHFYTELWEQKIGFKLVHFELYKPLILWINDGLMAVFFFLIGLEIKRELIIGELNSLKKASFPLLGAVGGMLFPLLIYVFVNENPATANGWGVPMATDIAFSLAILKLLGDRVPLSLKIFLTAFAIVDDLGAVIVIAIFYSSGIKFSLLLIAAVIIIALFILSYRRLYNKYLFFLAGVVVWFLFLKSGIHPTIAGVLMAFTIPIRTRIKSDYFNEILPEVTKKFHSANNNEDLILNSEQISYLGELEERIEQVQSPLQHLEHNLHNWVAFFIMPVFAFSNAGITLSSFDTLDKPLMITLILALILGNLIGITLMTFIGDKLKLITLPEDLNYRNIIGIALLAGVGFTMSIFITNLAFTDPNVINSVVSGMVFITFRICCSLNYKRAKSK